MANDTQVHWLTQDSYDRLMAEKEALIANRPLIAAEAKRQWRRYRQGQSVSVTPYRRILERAGLVEKN